MALIDRYRKERPQEPKVIQPEPLGDWYDEDDDEEYTDLWDDPSFYPDDYKEINDDDD
jgi:hypothetical protein